MDIDLGNSEDKYNEYIRALADDFSQSSLKNASEIEDLAGMAESKMAESEEESEDQSNLKNKKLIVKDGDKLICGFCNLKTCYKNMRQHLHNFHKIRQARINAIISDCDVNKEKKAYNERSHRTTTCVHRNSCVNLLVLHLFGLKKMFKIQCICQHLV